MNKSDFYSIVGRDDVSLAVRAAATPAFLYFGQVLRKRHADLIRCLPPSFNVYYAVKANPNPSVLRELASMGVGADVASSGELDLVLAQGIRADRIEFSGPGKTEGEVAAAIKHGVSSINAESLAELETLARASVQLGIQARVGVRINPGVGPSEAGLKMGGSTQFGIPVGQLEEALRFVRAHREMLCFTGLHVHAGSQLLSSAAIAGNFQTILDLAMRIIDLGILPLRKVNFGGGWGIVYFPHQTPLDLADLTARLAHLFSERICARLKGTRCIVEPGRFLVGECGIYVTTVLYKKPGAQREFLIVDGGMHQHYLLAGGMGQVIRRNFEMDAYAALCSEQADSAVYDVAGCLCTPQDVLATDYRSEQTLCSGDRLVFFNSGAYGRTASPVEFLGHHPPAEVML